MSEGLRPHHGVRRPRHSRHGPNQAAGSIPMGQAQRRRFIWTGGDSCGHRDTCGRPGSAAYCRVFVARSLLLSLSFHTCEMGLRWNRQPAEDAQPQTTFQKSPKGFPKQENKEGCHQQEFQGFQNEAVRSEGSCAPHAGQWPGLPGLVYLGAPGCLPAPGLGTRRQSCSCLGSVATVLLRGCCWELL